MGNRFHGSLCLVRSFNLGFGFEMRNRLLASLNSRFESSIYCSYSSNAAPSASLASNLNVDS